MFNSDQRSWMDYLAALPAEAKCDCGWSRRGECFGPRCYGKADRGGFVPKDKLAFQEVTKAMPDNTRL